MRREEVVPTTLSRVESAFAVWAFSVDAFLSALDAPLESESPGVNSVTLASAEAVVGEAALWRIS